MFAATFPKKVVVIAAVAMLLPAACAYADARRRPRTMKWLREAAAQVPGAPPPGVSQVSLSGRTYLVLDSSKPEQPAPLVIALHGGGGNAATMVGRWKAKAQEVGLIVVFPNGTGRNERVGTWNAGGCCAYAMNNDSDDVGFVKAVIDDVSKTHRVNPRRIYVTGMSNGGMLAHKIAIALSDRLAGAAVVAGALFGNEQAPANPVPMLIMHGEKDQIVGFDGGLSPTELVARSQSAPFKSAQYAADFWRGANGCSAAPQALSTGDVTVETSASCRSGSEVVFYRLASANHVWPGTESTAVMIENNRYDEINATDVIWSFFSKHARR